MSARPRIRQRLPHLVGDPEAEHVALLIAIVAIGLRLYRRSPTWPSSDAANLPDLVSFLVCRGHFRLGNLAQLALYRLGGVQPLVLYAQMSLLWLLRWHVTELTWESSQILVSAASTYAAFLFAREVAGPAAGLSASGMLALTPLGISFGRHLGAPWPYEEGFQYLLLFLVIANFRRPDRTKPIGLCVALAIYFWVGNQMLGILPALLYTVAVGVAERNGGQTRHTFLKRQLTPWLALPAASLGLLFYCTFSLHKSHLYHAVFQKRHMLGFYVESWLEDASRAVGASATFIALSLVLLGVLAERRRMSYRHVPLVLFLAYSAPFWFLIPPGSTLTRGYVMYGISALLIAACTAAFSPSLRDVKAPVLLAVIGFVQAGGSVAATYQLVDTNLFDARPFQGTYMPNNGIKAAAAWIRTRGPARGSVLSDASGGTGLEPSVVDMYLRRPAYGTNDAPSAHHVYAAYARYAKKIEYILVSPDNHDLAAIYFPSFSDALDVLDGPSGALLLSVYTREHADKVEVLDVHEGDVEFRTRHSMLCSR